MSIDLKQAENTSDHTAKQRNEITRAFGLYSRYKSQEMLDLLCETLARITKEVQDQNTNKTENKNDTQIQDD